MVAANSHTTHEASVLLFCAKYTPLLFILAAWCYSVTLYCHLTERMSLKLMLSCDSVWSLDAPLELMLDSSRFLLPAALNWL